MASPTVRAKSTVTASSATSLAPAKPAGTASGDVLLAIYYSETGAVAITMPTGFTNLVDLQFKATGRSTTSRLRVDWKIADGTEGSTLTWSWTTAAWCLGVLWAVQGAQSSGTPVELQNSNSNNGAAALKDTDAQPTVALTGNATVDDLIFLANGNAGTFGPTWAAPSGWTLEWNSADDGGFASKAQASGGAPAATTMTATDSGGPTADNAGVVIVAVKSPAAGPTPGTDSATLTDTTATKIGLGGVTQAATAAETAAVGLGTADSGTLAEQAAIALAQTDPAAFAEQVAIAAATAAQDSAALGEQLQVALFPRQQPYQAAVLADTPVSYWRLGETSGATAVDVMGVRTASTT